MLPMEIVQLEQEPRTLNRLPLRGPPDLPLRRLVSWREGQCTRVIVPREVACMLGGKTVEVLNMGMQDVVQCKVQNEGATVVTPKRLLAMYSVGAALWP